MTNHPGHRAGSHSHPAGARAVQPAGLQLAPDDALVAARGCAGGASPPPHFAASADGLLAVPARDPGQARLQRGLKVVQVLLGLALLVAVAVVLINQLPGYDWRGQLQTLALTIWLTAGALPFIAWLSLYSNYQLAFMHMRQRGGRHMADAAPTPLRTIIEAAEIGRQAGLRHVYPGNVAGVVVTHCAGCGETLIRRSDFTVLGNPRRQSPEAQ